MPWESITALLKTRDPLYHALLQGVISLGGAIGAQTTLFFARFLSVIAGVALIPIIFVIGKKWFGTTVGILASIMMALSTFDIAWSRQVRMYALWDLLFWTTLACGIYILEQNKKKFTLIILWIMSAGATIATHRFGFLLFPLMILAWYLFVLRPRQQIRHRLIGGGIILGIYIVGMMVLLMMNNQATNYTNQYFFWLLWEHPMTVILSVLSIAQMIRKDITEQHVARISFLFGSIILFFSTLALGVPLLHYRYLLVLNPALFLLTSFALVNIITMFTVKTWRHIACGIIGIFVITVGFLSHEFTFWPKQFFPLEQESPIATQHFRSYTPQPDFKKMYAIIHNNTSADDRIITPYPTMTWWYLQRIDDLALPISLTSPRSNTGPTIEYYTQTAMLTKDQFEQWQSSGKHGWIIIDDLARTRLEHNILEMITTNTTVWTHDERAPFSSVTLYRF